MIVKLRDGFHDSRMEPIMLILSPEETASITNMKPGEQMIAFYPVNSGFSQELIKEWMYEGLNMAPATPAQENTNGTNKV